MKEISLYKQHSLILKCCLYWFSIKREFI